MWNTIKIIFLLAIVFFLLAAASIVAAFAYYAKDLPSPDKLVEREIIQSTKIYDRTGEFLLYDIHGEEKRTLIEFNQMPEPIKWATIIMEDDDFYHHHGIDFRGIARALWANVRGRQILEGGSTITQQLIKNTILTSERTFSRKFKEIILALEIEQKFSKDDILKMYLNEVAYGSNAYGIEAASQTFLNKHAWDLTLTESCFLASLPKAPTYYSPYGNHPEELKSRQIKCLNRLAHLGYITEQERDEAKEEKLNLATRSYDLKAPHFVMFIKQYLADKYGDQMLEQGGLKVITTLDMELQQIAEQAIENQAKKNLANYRAKNAALCALDPKTGQILAMVGSVNYFDLENDGNVNVCTRPRQPGSSFKPYVYATAFKQGFTPETIIFDLATDFEVGENKEYIPHNYNEKEYGPVTFRQGLAMSLNIASVKVLYLAGVQDSIKTAHEMGITTLQEPNQYGLSLVLGGGEVKLIDHVSAFGAFATEGVSNKPNGILRIESPQGEILEEFELNEQRVLDIQIARLINNILSDNETRTPMFGAASKLYLGERPVAAKTGTTNEFRDAWTIGYTPSLVAGVWVGNNDNSKMNKGAGGAAVAAPIWNEFMSRALTGKPIENFFEPEPVVREGEIFNGQFVVNGQVHSILYYLDKNSPQFNGWEGPVLVWALENGYNLPPPQVEITQATMDNKIITVKAQVQALQKIQQVDFFFDDQLIMTDTTKPYSITFTIDTSPDNHLITVKAYDTRGNMGQDETTITIP